jgi:FAD/FMN-containing dehydrogenase
MVSTNAAGPHSVKYGSVRRWVEALDLITADGEPLTLRRGVEPRQCAAVQRFKRAVEPILRARSETIRARFPRTRKNSSGYALDAWLASHDLLDLVIGSEGTLAFVTGIEWRLAAIPARYGGVRAALSSIDSLSELLPRLAALEPSAVEYLDATFLRELDEVEGDGLLLVELEDDASDELESRVRQVLQLLSPHSRELEAAGDRRELERLWSVRHAASPILAGRGASRRSLQVIEDACVPLDRVGRYINAVRAAGERHEVELVIFGHAGDGNLHVNLQPDISLAGWEARVAAIFDAVSETVVALGGTLSGEHGDGRLRARAVEAVYGPEIMGLFRLVKQAFDPVGILNPGIKLPSEADRQFGSLKVGQLAEALPEDIERALREIERSANYSVSRLELADAPIP